MKKLVILLLFILAITPSFAQTRLYESVYISPTTTIKKDIQITYPFIPIPGEDPTETVKETKSGKEITRTRKLVNGSNITETKTLVGTEMEGYCNLISKDKESDKVYVDYWIYPSHTPSAGATIRVRNYTYNQASFAAPGNPVPDISGYTPFPNQTLENCYYSATSATPLDGWYVFIEREYEITEGGTTYYYYDLGLSKSNYYFQVDTHFDDTFSYSGWDVGVITIPIKLRFAGKYANPSFLSEKSDFNPIRNEVFTDFSTGVTIGKTWGGYSFQRSGKETTKLNDWSFTIAGFAGLTGTTLDSTATRKYPGLMRKDEKVGILVISSGVGLIGSYQNINFTLHLGRDFGAGQYATKWNYDSTWWLGLGIGYKLNIWKKEE